MMTPTPGRTFNRNAVGNQKIENLSNVIAAVTKERRHLHTLTALFDTHERNRGGHMSVLPAHLIEAAKTGGWVLPPFLRVALGLKENVKSPALALLRCFPLFVEEARGVHEHTKVLRRTALFPEGEQLHRCILRVLIMQRSAFQELPAAKPVHATISSTAGRGVKQMSHAFGVFTDLGDVCIIDPMDPTKMGIAFEDICHGDAAVGLFKLIITKSKSPWCMCSLHRETCLQHLRSKLPEFRAVPDAKAKFLSGKRQKLA
jgi:hypothetical protein